MQTAFFGLCVVTDIVHMTVSNKAARSGLPSRLLKTRDYIFTVLALPVGTVSVSNIYDEMQCIRTVPKGKSCYIEMVRLMMPFAILDLI